MKLVIGLAAAAVALVIPLSANAAAATEYSPLCDAAYQAAQPAMEPLFQSGPGYAHMAELALCGENKHG